MNGTNDMDHVGEYCRQVEDHLTKVNGGHLVRVVGPAFELVRRWAEEGVPMSVVFRGIERKAERRALKGSGRPLRLEFCEGDVTAVFDAWRRAIGLTTGAAPLDAGADAGAAAEAGPRRKPSLSKHAERAIDRLSRAAGRVDWPDALREEGDRVLVALAMIRDAAKTTRGAAREDLAAQLEPLDAALLRAAREAAPAPLLAQLSADSERDLSPFRGRLAGEAWRRSLVVTVDRLLRDRFGLPTLVP